MAAHGGLQVIAYPMKAKAYEDRRRVSLRLDLSQRVARASIGVPEMGLAPGCLMRQEA